MLLAGVWLSHSLSKTALVWSANEGIPGPMRIAAAVRVLVILASAAAAAEHLEFARPVFLAAFVIVAGGIVLAAAIAAGLSLRKGGPDNHP